VASVAYSARAAQKRTTMSPVQERRRSTSFALAPEHLAWLDAKRQHGAISRSAALRQALDDLMRMAALPEEEDCHD
jgi:hypothetical protein